MRGPRAAALLCAVVLGLGGTTAAYAATTGSGPAFGLEPFEFVGTAEQCGGTAGADTVTAKWDNTDGNPAPSILLEKLEPITNCAAAGIDIATPLEGGPVSALTELNFQYKGYCGGGAPRFNIVTDQGTAFLGCNEPLGTRASGGNGWTEVVFDKEDITAALERVDVNNDLVPDIDPATAVLEDLYIIFDEPGSTHVDNISVNENVVGSPTSASSKEDCKKGGYKNFYNPAFANQGDCVSYFATHGKNKLKPVMP